MKRADLLRAVGREPLFSTGMLLSPGVRLQEVRKQLSRWTADGTVVQVRRGLYALGEPYRTVEPHPYEVSNALVPGSYVSLETVLADHGLIPEAVFATTAVTTGRPGTRTTPFGTFVYQHLKTDLFWGYRTQELGGNRRAFVAVPEKALLDLGYLRSHSGEPAFARELRLQHLDSVDFERLTTMAHRFSSRQVERFADKVAALLCRDWIKGRDVYDLAWYLSDPTWPEPNEVLLTNTLQQSGPAHLAVEVAGWKSALVHRLSEAPWEGVKTDVERFLERPAEAWMVEREAVLDIMAQRGWRE